MALASQRGSRAALKRLALAASAVFSSLAAVQHAQASFYYFDGDTANTTHVGQTGSWNLSTLINWRQDTPDGTLIKWPGSSGGLPADTTAVAVFTDLSGVVTLGSGNLNIVLNQMQFSVSGFRVAPNGGSVLKFSGTTPSVNTDAGVTATLQAPFINSFTKTGDGTLILSYSSGNVAFAPTSVTVNAGTLVAASLTSFGKGSIAGLTLSGGVFDLNGGVLSNALPVVNIFTGPISGAGSTITNNGASASTLQAGISSSAASSYSGVIQNGASATSILLGDGVATPTWTLTGNNTYSGATTIASGTLSISQLANINISSNIGKGSAAGSAADLQLSGGALQYTGATTSTNRLFAITAKGGTIDASGTGPANFNNGGAALSADPAPRAATTNNNTGTLLLTSVSDLVVGMTITGANIAPGTTVTAVNGTSNVVTLSANPTTAGADTVSFSTRNRTLTLTGSNTGDNTMGDSLSDSAGGGTLGLTKSGAGSWTLAASNSYTGVTTVQAGALTMAGATAWAPALSGPNGANITGGRLVLDYSGGSSPAMTVKDDLTSSFATGFASGQLRSSTATSTKGLGWNDDGISKVTVMYTFFGDANLDGTVNALDFNALASNYGASGKSWSDGDSNYDGLIDSHDFVALAGNFGQSLPGPGPALGSLVPEPSTLSGVAIITSLLVARRRRRYPL